MAMQAVDLGGAFKVEDDADPKGAFLWVSQSLHRTNEWHVSTRAGVGEPVGLVILTDAQFQALGKWVTAFTLHPQK